ncbi:MAG: GntR family transcriptional regulator [Bosea sp. (in: a-proteobacteria)]
MLEPTPWKDLSSASSAPRRERKLARGIVGPGVRASAASIIESDLRQAIISMDLIPGSALNEKELIARYGVSRTPVREALIRLRDDGLVEVFPQSGTFVGRISMQSIPEAMTIRETLECLSAERAAIGGSADGLAAMQGAIAEQAAAAARGDQQAFHEADEAFHAAISEAAGLPGVWRLIQTMKMQVDRCRRLTLPVRGRMDRVVIEHSSILEAIRLGDAAAASDAVSAHLGAVIPDIDQMTRDHPDYFV